MTPLIRGQPVSVCPYGNDLIFLIRIPVAHDLSRSALS